MDKLDTILEMVKTKVDTSPQVESQVPQCDISFCGHSEYAYAKPQQAIMMGDSITFFAKQEKGFQWLLQKKLNETSNIPRISILNRGYSGQTTNYLLRNLESRIFSEKIRQNLTNVAFFTIMMGA